MKKQTRFSQDIFNMVRSGLFETLIDLGYAYSEISEQDLNVMTHLACTLAEDKCSFTKNFREDVIDYYYAHK